jgi:hypothetical protein
MALMAMKTRSTIFCQCGCGELTSIGGDRRPCRYIHGHNRKGTGSTEGWIEQGMRFVSVDGKKRPLHRIIMEEHLGRKLAPDEIVRHLDGDLLNNEISNLRVVTREEHFLLSMTSESKEQWSEDEKDQAVRLYVSGRTIDEVARGVGRSYHATRRLLGRHGVLRTPQQSREVRRLFGLGSHGPGEYVPGAQPGVPGLAKLALNCEHSRVGSLDRREL